jgi:hypothetical protein
MPQTEELDYHEWRAAHGAHTLPGYPYFGTRHIEFNGWIGHNNFIMPLHCDNYLGGRRKFQECDTKDYAYDVAVRACLIIFQHFFPKTFFITSEEVYDGWQKARNICQEVIGYGADFDINKVANRHLTKGGLRLIRNPMTHAASLRHVGEVARWNLERSNHYLVKHKVGHLFHVTVHEHAALRDFDPVELIADNVGHGQWWATVFFLRQKIDEPAIEPFLIDSFDHGWHSLAVAADLLEENGSPKAGKLRSYFPKQKPNKYVVTIVDGKLERRDV